MKELVQAVRELARTRKGTHGIAQGHLLKREEQICPPLDAGGICRYLPELTILKQCPELARPQREGPSPVCVPLVFPLPRDVGLIVERTGKVMQELPAAPL